MLRWSSLVSLALATCLWGAAGCDDGGDGGPADGSVPDESLPLPGLSGEVEVVQDDRGMWHIYAENLEDAYRVQGYLMARDRMFELELFRRQTRGELAEVFGSSVAQDDRDARFEGHARLADQIWDTLGAEEQALLQAFADGVTARIHEVQDDPDLLPRGSTLIPVAAWRDWEPTDTLSIARYMTASLSFDMTYDVDRQTRLEDFDAAFPADACSEAPEPPNCTAREARAGAFHDLYPFAPTEEVAVVDGFPNTPEGTDTGFTALRPGGSGTEERPERPRPSRRVLEAARSFADRLESLHERVMGGDAMTRGSNSWVVSGDHTASGYPIMNNDPHLSLSSPALFWYAHINTKRLGDGDVNVQGLALVGAPGVLLGYNDHIAWGMTTHGYDVTDNWVEQVTEDCDGVIWDDPADGLGNPIEVPFEVVTETLDTGSGTETLEFLKTDHHGFIIPGTLDCEEGVGGEAISVRWTGMEPTNELGAILGLNRASSIEEAEAAYDSFDVGGQTIVVAANDGRIYYTSDMNLPVRSDAAMTYDPATQTGMSPCFLMPGHTGEYEWEGYLSDEFVPHALDPAKGFIATANGDATGATFDGDPHDDAHFIGCDFSDGYRIRRITERLEEMIADGGGITVEDMQALQADAQSPHGRNMTPVMLEELTRAEEEADSPGTHPDLTEAVSDAGSAMTTILAMRDRLATWADHDYDTPAGLPDSGSAEPVEASIATSIFNLAYSYLLRNTFFDEFDALDGTMDGNLRHTNGEVVRTIEWAVRDNAQGHLTGWDGSLRDGEGDMVWWDDLNTEGVVESRGDRIVRAFAEAAAQLESLFGTDDMDEWRWGKLHTFTAESLVGSVDPTLNIPKPDDPDFPDGFPRHGDRHVVDASNFGVFNVDGFSYGSGPQQRNVVVMTPDGPEAYNALPGGQSIDPDSPHHADEMELWRKNEAPAMYFQLDDVQAHAETTLLFTPN
ncbi:MAG: penicillin acylase family protein [Myxococcota bacterium]